MRNALFPSNASYLFLIQPRRESIPGRQDVLSTLIALLSVQPAGPHARGGGGGGRGGPPDSDEPPELNSVQPGAVQSVRPFGVFVKMDGFRKYGLVHVSQVGSSFDKHGGFVVILHGFVGGTASGSMGWCRCAAALVLFGSSLVLLQVNI